MLSFYQSTNHKLFQILHTRPLCPRTTTELIFVKLSLIFILFILDIISQFSVATFRFLNNLSYSRNSHMMLGIFLPPIIVSSCFLSKCAV